MESRDAVARAGTIWTWRAAGGSDGRSNSASCVECITEPFGLRILMGLVAGRRLITWASTVQKCEVQPLSAIARVTDGVDEGGPTVEKEERQEPETLIGLDELDWVTTFERIGSPPRQVGTGRRRARPEEMVLLPPRMRKAVASSLWPSALLRQVAEVWFRFVLRP